MNDEKIRRAQGERGTALILAIAFMVVVGAISAVTVSTLRSGVNGRVTLDRARNREYDADAAIEKDIARIRVVTPNPGSNPAECTTNGVVYPGVNLTTAMRVICANTPSVSQGTGGPVSQSNVSFAACPDLGTAILCNATNPPVITAHVNFQIVNGQVTTFVQAWSVNR